MKSKLPAIVVFIFILVVVFLLFPRGCKEASPAARSSQATALDPHERKPAPTIFVRSDLCFAFLFHPAVSA